MEVRKAGVIDNSESHWSNPILMTRFLRTKLPDSFTCKSWVLTCLAVYMYMYIYNYIYILCICSFIRTYGIKFILMALSEFCFLLGRVTPWQPAIHGKVLGRSERDAVIEDK